MVLNQQLTNDQSDDFYEKIIDIMDGWLPFVTNYCDLKDKGWHKKYDEKNEYVSGIISDDEFPYLKQYHHAWSSCPKKKELIDLIRSCDYLDTVPALETLNQITGIDVHKTEDDEEATKAIALLEAKGKIKEGKIIL